MGSESRKIINAIENGMEVSGTIRKEAKAKRKTLKPIVIPKRGVKATA